MIQRFKREMSISHQEFYRLLPSALRNMDYEIVNYEKIKCNYANGKIEIIPGEEHKRQIASLVLPVLHIQFIFTEVSSDDIAYFFEVFSRVYQRGGG
jgi:hypothetical protein